MKLFQSVLTYFFNYIIFAVLLHRNKLTDPSKIITKM